MNTPYTITELDALMHACISFTEQHEPNFWAGNIGGRDGVSTDIPSVERMMDWVVETDKGLLESLGFGKDNVVYFRLGRHAQRIMNDGGFKEYLRNRTVREGLERVRIWAPIGISLLAAVVSILVWQVPKGSSKRIDDLATQLNELRSDQQQTKAMVTMIRANLDATSSPVPTATPTGLDTDGDFSVVGTTPPKPIDPLPGVLNQPWLLVASVAMLSVSFFLLYQAVAFQKWVTAKDDDAPNPQAGVGLAVALSLAMVLFSILYWIVYHPHPPQGPGLEVFLWVMSNRPSELATGPLLGSIVPGAMAIFKFVTAGFIMHGNAQEVPPLSRSPKAALAGAVFALISLAGSIATLVMFFFWIKNP
ncbi:MAG: hypothetical protein AABN95_10575 [Acidobacteriota bacterium]